MIRISFILLIVILFAACRREAMNKPPAVEPAPTKMVYTDFHNLEIKKNDSWSADVNADATPDLIVATLHIGDPLFQRDKIQFFINGGINTYTPVNKQEQAPMLHANDSISATAFSDYTWYNVSMIVLSEKIIELDNSVHWEGLWKNASHKFFPLQIKTANGAFYGWVELSFDITHEKLILHRSGFSKESGKTVKAGI